jgi:hypothetical protein
MLFVDLCFCFFMRLYLFFFLLVFWFLLAYFPRWSLSNFFGLMLQFLLLCFFLPMHHPLILNSLYLFNRILAHNSRLFLLRSIRYLPGSFSLFFLLLDNRCHLFFTFLCWYFLIWNLLLNWFILLNWNYIWMTFWFLSMEISQGTLFTTGILRLWRKYIDGCLFLMLRHGLLKFILIIS